MLNEKQCSKCKATKPYGEFNKSKDTKLGLSSQCKECSAEAHKRYRKYTTFECQDCGREFRRRMDYKKTDTSCCPACRAIRVGLQNRGRILEAARTGEYFTCDNCEKKHYKTRYQADKKFKHRFCSITCHGIWSAKYSVPGNFVGSANNKGEKNGRYKHGKRIGGHDRHKKLKSEITRRDGEGCLLCNQTESTNVHRILPGALGGKYEINNVVMLCNGHHSVVHKEYDIWKEALCKLINSKVDVQ